jgi:hypothetical protein
MVHEKVGLSCEDSEHRTLAVTTPRLYWLSIRDHGRTLGHVPKGLQLDTQVISSK